MSSPVFKIVKPSTEAEKTTRTTLECHEVTANIMKAWKMPPFQRPLRINQKVLDLAAEIKENDGVITGVLTLGLLDGQRWLVDGQHRREAFFISECLLGYCDVRVVHFDSMAEMAAEFYKVNSSLARMRPDDYLRALEASDHDGLGKLRRKCSFVGYDMVRRGNNAPMISMSAVLRCWATSGKEVPQSSGMAVKDIAGAFAGAEVDQLISFLTLAFDAWGRDPEYVRLYGALNLALCMWLYRRMVITPYSPQTPKLTDAQFSKCLQALSASSPYLDYLTGRQLSERDRSPAYQRIRTLFAKRIEQDTGKKVKMPAPAWASNASKGPRGF